MIPSLFIRLTSAKLYSERNFSKSVEVGFSGIFLAISQDKSMSLRFATSFISFLMSLRFPFKVNSAIACAILFWKALVKNIVAVKAKTTQTNNQN